MRPTRDNLLKEVLTRAATSPESLFLATTGVLLTLNPQTWPIGVAALVADVGLLWSRLRNSQYAHGISEQMQRTQWREMINRLEQLSAILDHETSAALASIVESQERLLAMYGDVAHVPHTRTELTSLLQHCLGLAEKRQELQGHIAAFSHHDIQREQAHLRARQEGSGDPATRALYQQALDQKLQEMRNQEELVAAVTRIDGQLAVVQATFDNILSRMIRMQSVEPQRTEAEEEPILRELNQLTTRVAELESSLSETLTVGR
jgi:hypothetical protein